MKHSLLTLSALIVLAGSATAQGVSGRVLDASTGEGPPNANIQVEGTLRGTVTNIEGEFRMRLDAIPSVLRPSSLSRTLSGPRSTAEIQTYPAMSPPASADSAADDPVHL